MSLLNYLTMCMVIGINVQSYASPLRCTMWIFSEAICLRDIGKILPRSICSITLDLEGLENLCFRSIIGYTPNRFIQLEFFFSYATFCSKNLRKLHFFKVSQFFGYCQYPNDNLMFTERVKVLNSLYNHIKSFLKCCCTFGDNWLFCFKK